MQYYGNEFSLSYTNASFFKYPLAIEDMIMDVTCNRRCRVCLFIMHGNINPTTIQLAIFAIKVKFHTHESGLH